MDAPDPELNKELLMKKAEFDILKANKATAALLKSCHKYYEFEGKTLAHQVRQYASAQHITQITMTMVYQWTLKILINNLGISTIHYTNLNVPPMKLNKITSFNSLTFLPLILKPFPGWMCPFQ